MRSRYKYADEEIDYVRKIAAGRYNDEIAILFNEKFDANLTESMIKSLKANHKIRSDVPRQKPNPDAGLFTKIQKDFIKESVKGLYSQELADLVNKTFNLEITARQMNTYKKNHNLRSGLDTGFKKGQKAWNKGLKGLRIAGSEKSWFKKGNKPLNYKPVGSESIDSKDGYTLIKVQDSGTWSERWRHKHVVVWEKENGPVPAGHVILFADGNRQNFDLDNLIPVTRAHLALLNNFGLIKNNTELTKVGIAMADLQMKIIQRKKEEV